MGHPCTAGALFALGLWFAAAAPLPVQQASDRIVVKLPSMSAGSPSNAAATRSPDDWRIRLGLPEGVSLRAMHRSRNQAGGIGVPTSIARPSLEIDRPVVVELNGRQSEVERLLCARAQDRVGGSRDTVGRDNYFGYGRLNALFALQLARVRLATVATAPDAASLNWAGLPENADEKRPLRLEFSHDLVNWTPADIRDRILYAGPEASWADDGSSTGTAPGSVVRRFYRSVIIR